MVTPREKIYDLVFSNPTPKHLIIGEAVHNWLLCDLKDELKYIPQEYEEQKICGIPFTIDKRDTERIEGIA